MEIYKDNVSKLIQLNNNNFSVEINNLSSYKNYANWIKKRIRGEMKQERFLFKAYKVETLTDLLKRNNKMLSYHHLNFLFLDLGKQLDHLEKDGYGIMSISKKDIVVIHLDDKENNIVILFLNIDDCEPIINNNYQINMPYDTKYIYNSPELSVVNALPFKFNYRKSIIYSIALLVIDCLKTIKDMEYSLEYYSKHIECILGTKLYWALLRCLENEPEERFFLYI